MTAFPAARREPDPQVKTVQRLKPLVRRSREDVLADIGRTLEPGSTILVARKGETEEVDMTVIPGEVTPEKVTVPPEELSDEADELTAD